MHSLIRIYDRVCLHACSDKVSISINLNNTIIFFFHVLKAWNAVIISKLANFKCKKVTTRKPPPNIFIVSVLLSLCIIYNIWCYIHLLAIIPLLHLVWTGVSCQVPHTELPLLFLFIFVSTDLDLIRSNKSNRPNSLSRSAHGYICTPYSLNVWPCYRHL